MVMKILIGTVLGFLSGLGIGGGSLLILWLTMAAGMEQTVARGINLLFFLPAALIAILLRWHQGGLNIKKVLPAMAAGSISAAVFALLSTRIDVTLLKKGFGILLLATGARELCYRQKK